MPVGLVLQLIAAVQYHLYTAMLFTWTDYKTIFFPIVCPSFCLLSDFQHVLNGA